ncbi:hypothetical protein [Nocardiopsis sp. HUAS JQ3]|uniref:hypothetical protein n=1 Tax=Nocardiopsis sp. HUAS JQ3 TaxID=3061629 RepID=UPI0023A94255|nr:hypothetical protein [Nocardiopsis sp. HUAS JQ3]WDZ90099.1 hypothetical protein PV789_24880 [Nocardiopsis sp. HUAS JQ3]
MPTTVSEAAWTWEGPEDSALLEILPMPTGAVLHMQDGAVELDTRTGEEVWSYRLLEAEAELAVSPDGSLVAVSAGGSLTLLDSGTGEEVRFVEHGETEAGYLSLGGGPGGRRRACHGWEQRLRRRRGLLRPVGRGTGLA